MKYILPVFFLYFLFGGCKPSQPSQQPEKQLVITPGIPSEYISDLTPYLDTLILLPLETTPNSLVSIVTKMLILPDGRFIISTPQSLLAFNKEGKYLQTIGKKGRGPDEYLGAVDICLNQAGDVLNILTPTKEVVSYQINNGTFLRKIHIQSPAEHINYDAIASGSDNSFFLFSGRQDIKNSDETVHALFHHNQEGQLLHSYLPVKDYFLSIGLITQTYDNQYILRPQNQDNIFYYLKDSLPIPQVRIDFGKKTIPNQYSPDVQTYLRADYNKMPIYIHQTAQHLYFAFCGPEALEHYCIFSFDNKKTINWKRKGNDSYALFQMIGSDREFFYGLYNDYRNLNEIPISEIDLLKKAVIEKCHPELNENSNPCLIKIRFRL